MSRYALRIQSAALKQLSKLPRDIRTRVQSAIDTLADDPRPPGVKKLKGEENGYRIRVGDYRVLYSIFDDVLLVEVVRIGDRKDVYD